MKKLVVLALILAYISTAFATSVEQENVLIDLDDSTIEIDIEIKDLTANQFTYLINYPVSNPEISINGENTECEITHLQIGTELSCEPPETDSFEASLKFDISSIVTERQDKKIFEYTQRFYRPTETYTLRVVLPSGAGLLNQENTSISVIQPQEADIGSDGQRHYVEWTQVPSLGETTNFQIAYENLNPALTPLQIIVFTLLIGIISVTGFLYHRIMNKEDIENIYEDLEDDERELIELLRSKDSEALQKDLVEELDYSKAKVSGMVSSLVEKDVVVKEKEGRSNRINISKNYRS